MTDRTERPSPTANSHRSTKNDRIRAAVKARGNAPFPLQVNLPGWGIKEAADCDARELEIVITVKGFEVWGMQKRLRTLRNADRITKLQQDIDRTQGEIRKLQDLLATKGSK